MNKPIRTIAAFCMVLFLALMLNATYLQYYKAGALDQDSRNRRVIAASFARERGAILVGRTAVAQSVRSKDVYKYQRVYPQPFKYAPVTGWFSYYSQTGVELSQNGVLSGEDTRLLAKLMDLLSNNTAKGGSVQLTVNAAAQNAAYEGLSALPGPVQGAVVALEPSTGKILAMVSLPSYDPNRLASHDLGAVREASAELQRADGQPLLNRAIQTRLPPGSTFKVVTAAAAIENGLYTADDLVPGGATYQLPLTGTSPTGQIDNDGRDCGTDRIPFAQAMENSCNTSFAAIANEVGARRLTQQAEAFGFNSRYLDDLAPQAESVFPHGMDKAQTGQAGIGQFEVASTPLQMAMVVAGIANGGVVMQPYLVDEIQSPELDVLAKTEPSVLSEAVSASTASQLTQLLVSVVVNGTARPAAIPGIKVAGKTGTAQSGLPDVPPYAWFVSFAPADDPQVAVAVMIQSAGIARSEIAGGVYGGPIAKAVMQAVIG